MPDERLAVERGVLRVLRSLPSLRPPLRRGQLRKVDRLATVRFGSARYSVPARLVGAQVQVSADDRQVVICHDDAELVRHPLVAPGQASIIDEHYGRPRGNGGGNGGRPARSIRPRSHIERSLVALGPAAERFLRAAAAAGTPRLASEVAQIVALDAAHGHAALLAALERATTFPAVHRGRRALDSCRRRWRSGIGTTRPATDAGAAGRSHPAVGAYALDGLQATPLERLW